MWWLVLYLYVAGAPLAWHIIDFAAPDYVTTWGKISKVLYALAWPISLPPIYMLAFFKKD